MASGGSTVPHGTGTVIGLRAPCSSDDEGGAVSAGVQSLATQGSTVLPGLASDRCPGDGLGSAAPPPTLRAVGRAASLGPPPPSSPFPGARSVSVGGARRGPYQSSGCLRAASACMGAAASRLLRGRTAPPPAPPSAIGISVSGPWPRGRRGPRCSAARVGPRLRRGSAGVAVCQRAAYHPGATPYSLPRACAGRLAVWAVSPL